LRYHKNFGLNRPGRDNMGKGETKKSQRLLQSRRSISTSISWVRYELVVSLAILMTLAGAKLVTASEYAQDPSSTPGQLGVTATVTSTVTIIGSPGSTMSPPFTPTPLQDASSTTGAAANVSPPDKLDVENERLGAAGQWVQIPGWLLSVAGGILVWAAGGIALFSIMTLLFLVARRRRRLVLAPPPTASIPFLESPEGNLYFRLDKLDGDGLIIGRGKRGVDLRIEESNANADTVSNSHARIYYDATCGYVVIEDLDSTNGIYINGRRAPRKNLLKDGWVIGLGSVRLTYHDGESDTGPLD
jgi:hypothetical protein